MSPQLARKEFFLRILNEPPLLHADRAARWGKAVVELYEMLVTLAECIRDGRPCADTELERLNRLLQEHGTLELALVPEYEGAPLPGGATLCARIRGRRAGQEIDAYVEAIISLLEAQETGGLALANCAECNGWYIPYSRSPGNRFCSTRCRNRANYRARKAQTT